MLKPGKKPDKQSGNFYAKYSSIAFQMAITIFLGVYGGIKADIWLNTSPIFALLGVCIGFGLALYLALKDLIKK